MNNYKVPIKKIRRALEIIELISDDKENVHFGLTESGIGIEFCFKDYNGKLRTIILGPDDASYQKIEEWKFL